MRSGYIDPTDACPCIPKPDDPRTRIGFVALVRRCSRSGWTLNAGTAVSIKVGVAIRHFILFIVVDMGLKKQMGLFFIRIVLDVIAWMDRACRTRVNKMD